jgi:hypothetical protein
MLWMMGSFQMSVNKARVGGRGKSWRINVLPFYILKIDAEKLFVPKVNDDEHREPLLVLVQS